MRDAHDLKLLEQPKQSACFGGSTTVRLRRHSEGSLLLNMVRADATRASGSAKCFSRMARFIPQAITHTRPRPIMVAPVLRSLLLEIERRCGMAREPFAGGVPVAAHLRYRRIGHETANRSVPRPEKVANGSLTTLVAPRRVKSGQGEIGEPIWRRSFLPTWGTRAIYSRRRSSSRQPPDWAASTR